MTSARGLLTPFRRDRKRDFASSDGDDLLASKVLQVLGTEGATARSSGELPWRTAFGTPLQLLRHQRNDVALNVDANRLVVVEGSFTDANGRPVRVTATNPKPAEGGTDRQTIASAKLLAPEGLRALTRSVAREDFEIHARAVAGVARALMLTSNEDPTIPENTGVLYVVPEGGGLPTPALKNVVLKQVTEVYPCTLTFQVSVQDPVYRPIDVVARIFLRQGATPGVVRDRVRASLAEMFRITSADGTPNASIDFGFNVRDADGNPAGEVAWSDVLDVIHDTGGVRKVGDGPFDLKLNGLPADVKLARKDFPALRAVTLVDGATGALL